MAMLSTSDGRAGTPIRLIPNSTLSRLAERCLGRVYSFPCPMVIGGGQAGLATGYYLTQQKRDFVVLDAHRHARARELGLL